MKLFYSIIVFISIVFSSCNNTKTSVPENKQQETPKALQEEKGSSGFFLSKRSYRDDLVENLYNELLGKNTELKTLEDNIDKLKDDQKDSENLFNTFDSKNYSYYGSANTHIQTIKDYVLKQKMKLLIDNSLLKYKTKIVAHSSLIAAIGTKDIALDDLHIFLKLTQTLGMIEKYQTNDLPSTKPLESISKAYDKIMSKTDSLTKK